ncbi:MAG: hypothetical protein CVT74_17430 [Alphaproteobacteria bacterium HGW-Alphaproteobacteria-13]|nr:MAG: hypothetical protein CVT74_17430 [Alphaproteobacteria bacterium HGW-Alphaproteobacteria-13]
MRSDGAVWCWGANDYHQVGPMDGDVTMPTAVPGVTGAVAVVAGAWHTCALLTGGQVLCWGRNNHRQMGNSSTEAIQATPAPVADLGNVVALGAGNDHTCAVLNSGLVRCWGRNDAGQLGDGSFVSSTSSPVPVVGLAGPLLAFALIGLIVLVMLRWRLPDDVPRFAARGAVASYPLSAGPGEPAGDDDDPDDDAGDATPLRWTDRRIRPWLLAGFIGGQAQAMMLGVIGFLILDRLHLRLKPDEGAAITGIVLMAGAFATLLAQWGLIPLLKPGPRATVLAGAALGGVGILMTGVAGDLHAIVFGFAMASLGFGLFRPGFTAGASLAVPRRDQGSVAGMTASINGSAYLISPAIGVLLYNWHAMAGYGLMAAFCGWLLLWGWSALKQDQPVG